MKTCLWLLLGDRFIPNFEGVFDVYCDAASYSQFLPYGPTPASQNLGTSMLVALFYRLDKHLFSPFPPPKPKGEYGENPPPKRIDQESRSLATAAAGGGWMCRCGQGRWSSC